MKICILSDSHDNRVNLRKIMEIAVSEKAEAILHCGDVVSPSTLRAITEYDIPLHVIHGNNAGDLVILAKMAAKPSNKIKYYGRDADITLANKRIFMVHYPHYAEGMALTGRYDVVCCGHSHRGKVHTVTNIDGDKTVLVNAGNTAGIGEEPKFVLVDLSTMNFNLKTLEMQ